MVQKGVAAAGAVLSAAGVGLMVGSVLMESFVVVVVPNEAGAEPKVLCEDDNLGNLGIFTASYNAECTKGSAFYDTFNKVEEITSQPTTSFPLLFSSQEGLPMFLDEAADFTDCETFWGEYGVGESAAFGAAAEVGFEAVDEQLGPIGAIVGTIPNSLSAVGDFVTSLWAEGAQAAADGIAEAVQEPGLTQLPLNNITSAGNNYKDLLTKYQTCIEGDITTDVVVQATCKGLAFKGDATQIAGFDFAVGCDCNTGPCRDAVTAASKVNVTDSAGTCTVVQPGLYPGLQKGFTINVAFKQNQTQIDGFKLAETCDCSTTECLQRVAFVASTVNVTGTCEVAKPDLYGGLKAKTLEELQGGIAQLDGGIFLLQLANTTLTIADNSATRIYELPEDFTSDANDNLCILLALDSQQEDRSFPAGARESELEAFLDGVATCKFETAAGILAENVDKVKDQLLAGVTLDASLAGLVADLVAGLMDGLYTCAQAPASPVNGCVNMVVYGMENDTHARTSFPEDLKVTELPESFMSKEWFFARAFGKNNSIEVLETLAQSVDESLASVAGFLKVCDTANVKKRSECIAFLKQSSGALVQVAAEDVAKGEQALAALGAADCSTPTGQDTVAFIVASISNQTVPAVEAACVVAKADAVPKLTSNVQGGKALTEGLWPGAINAAVANVINGTDSDARIALCKDDDKDKEIFETAQIMVPAAIALAALGMLVSFAAVGTNKKVLAIVGGVLSVLGGGVLLGALLYVRTAPVYALVAEAKPIDEVDAGSAYYKPGLAQTLALGGIAGPIFGGLLVLGSSFCGPSEEESQALTGKVDGTY